MRKVCVVITARPSYARIKTVLQAIQSHPDLQLQLIVGASALLERYGEVVNVIRADGFQPDAIVYMVLEGENLITTAKSTGLGVVELATISGSSPMRITRSAACRLATKCRLDSFVTACRTFSSIDPVTSPPCTWATGMLR